jgi:hypothetical protein
MNELEISLMESLRKANLAELGADLTDKALEAAGGIPVVGHLQKLWKVGSSVQTYLFIKKMVRFLAELKDIPQEERQAQIEKLEGDAKEEKKVGETLLLILDRLNNMQKPAMVGRAFKALLKGEITQIQFESISHAIDTLSISQIAEVARFYGTSGHRVIGRHGRPLNQMFAYGNPLEAEEGNLSLQAMAMCGLVSVDWMAQKEGLSGHGSFFGASREKSKSNVVGGDIAYYTTRLGFLFYGVVLNDSKPESAGELKAE